MIDREQKRTFGPVPSRRLGRSLGIDIVPFKTCTYDCIYCQLGQTTDKTVTRTEFFAIDKILRDVHRALDIKPKIDYLTLSGSGEPTLHNNIGKLISMLKREFSYPVAVLTNGSLLYEPDVAQSLMQADVVLPTLAADTETIFQCVHRPHPSLHFDTVVKGIINFSKTFKNDLWLELFLLDGINTIEETLRTMKEIVDEIKPQKIHLNTATRPPAEEFAYPVSEEKLESFKMFFGQNAEVITDFKHVMNQQTANVSSDIEQSILQLLKRRPCTDKDIATALSLHSIETTKIISHLVIKGKIERRHQQGNIFYKTK
ncbi:MAG: radical SAM protein [Chitinispirillaceae bacterium]|nr:radical SAM protein [Chitinispirillaceae bacterium]